MYRLVYVKTSPTAPEGEVVSASFPTFEAAEAEGLRHNPDADGWVVPNGMSPVLVDQVQAEGYSYDKGLDWYGNLYAAIFIKA